MKRSKRVRTRGPGIFRWRLRLTKYLLGGPRRWLVQGYAVGDQCLRYVAARNIGVAVYRFVCWSFGGVKWEELRLVRGPDHPRSVREADAEGDSIVAAARATSPFAAPQGARLEGMPFKHDSARAPQVVDGEVKYPDA